MLKLWASMPEYLLAAAANLVCSTKGRFHDAMHPCPTRSQKKPGRRAIDAHCAFCGILPVAGHFHDEPTPQSEGSCPPTQARIRRCTNPCLHGTAQPTGWSHRPLTQARFLLCAKPRLHWRARSPGWSHRPPPSSCWSVCRVQHLQCRCWQSHPLHDLPRSWAIPPHSYPHSLLPHPGTHRTCKGCPFHRHPHLRRALALATPRDQTMARTMSQGWCKTHQSQAGCSQAHPKRKVPSHSRWQPALPTQGTCSG